MNIDLSVLYKLIWGIGIMATVVAAAISALFQLINGWRERVSADRRHLRDLALKAAIVQWEHDVAVNADARAREMIGEEIPGPLGEVHFDMILVKKLKLIETFTKSGISPDQIEKGLREMRMAVGAINRGTTRRKSKGSSDK